MAYVAPTWVNGGPPALDAAALNAISQALAKLPMENGGTFATSGAAGLYNLINAAATLTSSTLASGDYVGVQDVSAGTGKRTTLSNLASWIGSNGTGAKIATGSYTGTGTYGSSNPNSITFPFAPKFVILGVFTNKRLSSSGNINGWDLYQPGTSSNYNNIFISGSWPSDFRSGFGFWASDDNSYSYGRASGNTLSWYNARSAESQFNGIGSGNSNETKEKRYFWIAFG